MQIFGVILAGGAGRRMGGADKARLMLGGQTLLHHAAARLAPQVAEIALSYNGNTSGLTADMPIFPDALLARGPLSGILAALIWAGENGADALATVAVDTPHFPCDLVAQLYGPALAEGRITLARAARLHPTFGLWPVSAGGDLARFLSSGQNPKIMDFCADAAHVHFPDEAAFANINTPADLAALTRGLA